MAGVASGPGVNSLMPGMANETLLYSPIWPAPCAKACGQQIQYVQRSRGRHQETGGISSLTCLFHLLGIVPGHIHHHLVLLGHAVQARSSAGLNQPQTQDSTESAMHVVLVISATWCRTGTNRSQVGNSASRNSYLAGDGHGCAKAIICICSSGILSYKNRPSSME